jgi:glutathione peroxidase
LTEKAKNGKMDTEVWWNFQRFMIDENGKRVNFVSPREELFCEKIVQWLEKK